MTSPLDREDHSLPRAALLGRIMTSTRAWEPGDGVATGAPERGRLWELFPAPASSTCLLCCQGHLVAIGNEGKGFLKVTVPVLTGDRGIAIVSGIFCFPKEAIQKPIHAAQQSPCCMRASHALTGCKV